MDLWQLRSTMTMSPGATVECQTTLFDVDVPLDAEDVAVAEEMLADETPADETPAGEAEA